MSGMWSGAYLRIDTQNTRLFTRDWTTRSKHADHSRINSERELGKLTYALNEHENLHSHNEYDDACTDSENYETSNGYMGDSDLLITSH